MQGECGGSLSPLFSPLRGIQTPCREGFVKGRVAQLVGAGAVLNIKTRGKEDPGQDRSGRKLWLVSRTPQGEGQHCTEAMGTI